MQPEAAEPAGTDPAGRGMAEGLARVIRVEGGTVWLEHERNAACAGCAGASGCGGVRKGDRGSARRITLPDDFAARPGERVVIGVPEAMLVRGSLIAYAVPILTMVAAAVGAEALGGGDGAAGLAAVAGLALGLVVARGRARILAAGGRLSPVFLRRAPADQRPCG